MDAGQLKSIIAATERYLSTLPQAVCDTSSSAVDSDEELQFAV